MEWDKHWDDLAALKSFYKVAQKSHWRRYKELLKPAELQNPNVLELGAGSGMLTEKILKKYGGKATLVDFSESAKKMFEKSCRNSKMQYFVGDVFTKKFTKKYDLVFSDGLVEHFEGKKQVELLKLHKKASKRFVVVFAPKPSKVYNTLRQFAENMRAWHVGYEEPMTMKDLKALCEKAGLEVVNSVEGVWQNGVLCSV